MTRARSCRRCPAAALAWALLAAVLVLLVSICLLTSSRTALGEPRDEGSVAADIASCVGGVVEGLGADDIATLLASEDFPTDSSSAQWLAFDFERLGLTNGSDAYLARLEAWVTACYAGPEKGLDSRESTTWSRVAIVVHALGGDPTAFGTDASGAPANLIADGIYDWSYTDDIASQGSNACIYGILALDVCGVAVPDGARYTEQDLIDSLLAAQAGDGSFALNASAASGSVDLTAMALSALAIHVDQPAVASAVDKALGYLSDQQSGDGRYEAEGLETSESSSMVIVGLCALGIDPAADERFVKDGHSALDGLMSFQRADGTFSHMDDDTLSSVSYLASEQALRALIAYEELLLSGDGNVYTADVPVELASLTDVSGLSQVAAEGGASGAAGSANPVLSWVLGLACGAAAAGIAWGVWHARRGARKRAHRGML